MRTTMHVPVPERRSRVHVVVLGLVLVALLGACAGTGGPGFGRPSTTSSPTGANVVLIVADDMRTDSLWVMSALGRLADERGVRFSRAYVTTPLCCPSRASILTGLSARHHGVLKNDPPQGGVEAFDDRSTLATWLQSAGVRTGLVGRYLNGYETLDVPPGWDFWFALWQFAERNGNYYGYRVSDRGERRYFDTKPESYSTRVLGQQARRFVDEDKSRPFMLLLAPRTPHGPATPDSLDAGTFKDLDLPLPPSYDEADVRDKPAWVRENGRLRPKEREELELLRRRQLESLLSLDREIEAIVETLRADGRLDRTWVIFTADNGLVLGEHRLSAGKSCAYEECVRVPLVVVPPPGAVATVPGADDRLVANVDLAPTIAAIHGAEPAGAVDGRSLLPLLNDPTAPWRDALVLEAWSETDGKQFTALVTGARKYVNHGDEDELYDVVADPYELENLARGDAYAAETARLAGHLRALVATPAGQEPLGLP